MHLDLCLLSCDLDSTYYDFFPLIKTYWKKKIGIDCILILVAKELPYSLMSEKDSIIMFPPIPNIPTAFQAQCIRLLYPCLLNFNGIIISDMDIIPLNNDFFSKICRKIPFVSTGMSSQSTNNTPYVTVLVHRRFGGRYSKSTL